MARLINYQGSMDALVWRKDYKNLVRDTELLVPVSHEAVFVKDGIMTDNFSMGKYSFTELPIGEGHLFSSENEKVNCQVYFIKKEGSYNIKWNVPKPVTIHDPTLKIPVECNLSGIFAIKIIDSKQFLTRQLTFSKKLTLDEVKSFFRERMILYIKDRLIEVMRDNKISFIELRHKLMAVSKILELNMRYAFESFGVSVESFMLKKADPISATHTLKEQDNSEQNENTTLELPETEIMYCKNCGEALPPMSVFCFKCGVNLSENK